MAALPVGLEAAVEMTASQGEDGVGATDRPKYAGSFHSRADYPLSGSCLVETRFNDRLVADFVVLGVSPDG